MLELTMLKKEAIIPDWPSGGRQTSAHFVVEEGKKGERVSRTTSGKPKKSVYFKKVRICTGDDGRTYLLGHTEYDQIVLVPGTLNGATYYHEGDEEWTVYKDLLYFKYI